LAAFQAVCFLEFYFFRVSLLPDSIEDFDPICDSSSSARTAATPKRPVKGAHSPGELSAGSILDAISLPMKLKNLTASRWAPQVSITKWHGKAEGQGSAIFQSSVPGDLFRIGVESGRVVLLTSV